jgi:hypothetical protein
LPPDLVFPEDQYNNYIGKPSCTASLAECYWKGELKVYTEGSEINSGEFHDLALAIYFHLLYYGDVGRWDIARRDTFDTPLWNGKQKVLKMNPDTTEYKYITKYNPDITLCLNGHCSARSEINYFAQGMYAAAAGETLRKAKMDAWYWKILHGNWKSLTEVYYWVEYGHNLYGEINDMFDL